MGSGTCVHTLRGHNDEILDVLCDLIFINKLILINETLAAIIFI
jgi:hypothetical protein